MLLMLVDERFVRSLDGFRGRFAELVNRLLNGFRACSFSFRIEEKMEVTNLLLAFLEELLNCLMMITTSGIRGSL